MASRRIRRLVAAAIAVAVAGTGLTGAAAAGAGAAGTYDVTVATVRMPGQVADLSAAQIGATITGPVNDWTRGTSNGQIGYRVVRTVDLPPSSISPCQAGADPYTQYRAFITAAAAAANWNPASRSERFVVYFPKYAPCSNNGGRALEIDAGDVVALNGIAHARLIEHELGHTLGLGHSNRYSCGFVADPLVDSRAENRCFVADQHNWDDAMGAGPGGYLNAVHLDRLGLLPAADVSTVTSTSTVTIAPIATGQGNRRVIKVAGYSGQYLLEYRAAVGLDAHLSPTSPYYRPGVRIHKLLPDASPDSLQLDADLSTPRFGNPDTVSPPVGQPIDLDEGTITVTVQSQTAAGATVRVAVNETLPAGPSQLRAVATTANIALSWDPSPTDAAANITEYIVEVDFLDDPDLGRSGIASMGIVDSGTTSLSSYLTDGVTARFRVASANVSGQSPWVYSPTVTIPGLLNEEFNYSLPPNPGAGGPSDFGNVHAPRQCRVFFPKVRYKGKRKTVRVKRCHDGDAWNAEIKKSLKKRAKKKAKRKARKLYARGRW